MVTRSRSDASQGRVNIVDLLYVMTPLLVATGVITYATQVSVTRQRCIQAIYREADVNHDGVVSGTELSSLWIRMGGQETPRPPGSIERLIESAPSDLYRDLLRSGK